jgi:16S rRNA (guanine527-N7)-methyltransferase
MINRGAGRARSLSELSALERLMRDAATLGVALSAADAARLLQLTQELARWNRSFNLTSITDPKQMLTHHLLDSLSVHPDLHGSRIADVGTGAGFPGLPLAVCNPARQFTLIDASGKKIRFVSHAARQLGLDNVSALHARAEAVTPAAPFDTVVARAFAPLPQLLVSVAALCGPATLLLAMKGKRPDAELAALPPPWQLQYCRALTVPGLAAARCVLALKRAP